MSKQPAPRRRLEISIRVVEDARKHPADTRAIGDLTDKYDEHEFFVRLRTLAAICELCGVTRYVTNF